MSNSNSTTIRFGEIVQCVNPNDKPEDLKYLVKFKGIIENIESVSGDKLQLRQDLGWMSSGMILAVIPHSLQALVNSLIDPVQGAADTITKLTASAHYVVSWQNRILSAALTTFFISLSAILWYIIAFSGHHRFWEIVFLVTKVAVAILIFMVFSLSSKWFRGIAAAWSVCVRRPKKNPKAWSIFTDTSQEAPPRKSTASCMPCGGRK